MTLPRPPAQKITISVPADLLAYADAQARRLKTSRSHFISQALAQRKASDEERLAAEGYRFYADEARAFAEASAVAVAEAFDHER
jgi:metal-responsive CopG/Arc/MetJ family transcriptional regulator